MRSRCPSGSPAQSFNDFVSGVRAQGGKSAVGVPAPASVPEFLVKVIAEKYGIDLVSVPYRGSAPMIADMLASQIPAGVASVPEFVENHKAGKLRVVAVLGSRRQAVLPDVPTFAELGLAGFEDAPYYGFFAPAGHAEGGDRPVLGRAGEGDRHPRGRGQVDDVGPGGRVHAAAAVRCTGARLRADVGEDHQGERLPAAVNAPSARALSD